MDCLRISGLFVITAVAEIVGCCPPWLVVAQGRTAWLLQPAAASMMAFALLLTRHPGAAGRAYAACRGVDVVVALLWLWRVDGVLPARRGVVGGVVCLAGMAVIALQPRAAAGRTGGGGP